jgi:hypothetical protein
MKIARLAGLMLVAVFAMSLVVASVAMAEPEFVPATGTFSGDSGTSILSADNGIDVVTCATNVASGSKTSSTTVGGVIVHFLNCKASGETKSGCTVKSAGAAEGLIVTNTLDGILGLILPKPASGSGVGLLLLPSSGSIFVTLAGNACTEETAITGTVAGEVLPIKSPQTTGKLTFNGTGSKANIKGFDPSVGAAKTAKLVAFSFEASQTTAELLTFSATTEVT